MEMGNLTNIPLNSSAQNNSEEFTQGKMFQLFDEAIELAGERAKWEFPVAKPTERYLHALKDLRKEWVDYIARKSNPDNPPLTPEEDAKATKKFTEGRIKLEQRRKTYCRHIKDNPIDTEKVVAKLRAKVEYKGNYYYITSCRRR